MVNAARLHSHEAWYVAAQRHQPPDGGSVDTGQPASRQRSGIVAPFPPRPGANGSRRYPGNPNQVAGRLRLVDQLPFGRRQTQLPPPRKTVREARPPRRPAAAPPRARRRPPPSSARTAPAALAAADPDYRSSPSFRRPAAAPTRRSTASASPLPRRARRRAPRHRSAPSTRPPGTSACRSSPCISRPGREQFVIDPALEQGLSSLRFSARISPSSS